MKYMLNSIGIIIYVLGLAAYFQLLPPGGGSNTMQIVALAVLIIHILEAAFKFKYVRMYPGSLTMSIILTLLFGAGHWKPLADKHARENRKQ